MLDACGVYATRLDANGLGHFRSVADQSRALPHEMLIPIVKVLTLEEIMLEDHLAGGDTQSNGDDARIEFENWLEQMQATRNSLR